MLKKFTGNSNISKKKQTAGRPLTSNTHNNGCWRFLFYIHLRNRKSSATHQVRGGGASKASDGGEKTLNTGQYTLNNTSIKMSTQQPEAR